MPGAWLGVDRLEAEVDAMVCGVDVFDITGSI